MNTDGVMKLVVGISVAAAVSLSGWNLLSTVGHEARIGIVEERSEGQKDRLSRIEDKVDRLLERIPPLPDWRRNVGPPDVPPPTRRRAEGP